MPRVARHKSPFSRWITYSSAAKQLESQFANADLPAGRVAARLPGLMARRVDT
jgi:hypothetical protein